MTDDEILSLCEEDFGRIVDKDISKAKKKFLDQIKDDLINYIKETEKSQLNETKVSNIQMSNDSEEEIIEKKSQSSQKPHSLEKVQTLSSASSRHSIQQQLSFDKHEEELSIAKRSGDEGLSDIDIESNYESGMSFSESELQVQPEPVNPVRPVAKPMTRLIRRNLEQSSDNDSNLKGLVD